MRRILDRAILAERTARGYKLTINNQQLPRCCRNGFVPYWVGQKKKQARGQWRSLFFTPILAVNFFWKTRAPESVPPRALRRT